MAEGPLEGLRVIDLTNDAGRFATKLLIDGGASVIRLDRGSPGPALGPADVDRRGGLLEWWYDAGKQVVPADLDTDEGRRTYIELARRADLIIETERPGRLGAVGIDHPDLIDRLGADPRLVQVSVTPFGRTGPRCDWATTDLVSAALGGVLSVCGEPDQPVAMWGRQAFNVAGFIAAISGLAAVYAARRGGAGQLVDVSIHEAVATTIEQIYYQYWFDDVLPYPKVAPRQGSLHWSRAYKVIPAREGFVMITPTPDFAGLIRWMVEAGWEAARPYAGMEPMELLGCIDAFMDCVAGFAVSMDAIALFEGAQARHIAFGLVQDVPTVASNPQHLYRGFFRPVQWTGTRVLLPGPYARFLGDPPGPPRPPSNPTTLDAVVASWRRDGPPPAPAGDSGAFSEDGGARSLGEGRPLEGVRVLDLSHVLAGPMGTRVLGDLGADVIKLQTTERAIGVNDPAHPYFYVYNRSKRAVSLDLQDPRSKPVIRGLIEASDVLIENFAAGVLDRLGLSYAEVSAWNPRIIYVTMSGCGHEGPWSRLVTYAPTIHALAGVTHLCNPPGRSDIGPGFSLTDHVVGLSAATAILSALLARQVSGVGQHVDIAQMETGSYLIGPALVDYLTTGRVAEPIGNRDPFGQLVPNQVYSTGDGRWLAVSCRDDADWRRVTVGCGIADDPALATVTGRSTHLDRVDDLVGSWAASMSAESAQAMLQAAGVPAGVVQDAGDLMVDPQLVARDMWGELEHAVLGRRPHDRYPAQWSRSRLDPYRVAPGYVGEHNFEVYRELLDLDDAAIAEGMASGLFG